MSIHLYAELLLNIKSISLHGTIVSPRSHEHAVASESATLETTGPLLRVSHGGMTATLRLPVKNIGNAKSTVHLPPVSAHIPNAAPGAADTEPSIDQGGMPESAEGRAREITARITLSGDDVASYLTLSAADEGITSESVPWSAPQLTADTIISCRECGEVAVPQGVREWRDLPREGWAELMEVWYCHKPVNHHETTGNEDAEGKRGYGANHVLEVNAGSGFVDSTSFLLHANDTHAKVRRDLLWRREP